MKIIILSFLFGYNVFLQPQPVAVIEKTLNKNKKPVKTTVSWGAWTKVSCYKGIEFRTSRGEFYNGTYAWNVQFRNLYNKKVKFNYNITEPEKEEKVRREQLILDIWTLAAGFDPDEEGNNRDAPHGMNYATSSNNVFVYITNVRFSNNGNWDTDFSKCDY